MLTKETNFYSGYFNGVDACLTLPGSGNVFSGVTDFTMECWFFPLDMVNQQTLFEKRTNNGTYDFILYTNVTAGKVSYYMSGGPYTSTGNYIPYQWNHVALIRYGSNHVLLLNGQVATTVQVTTPVNTGTNFVNVGFDYASATQRFFFKGYMSNVSFNKGVAKYSATSNQVYIPRSPIIADGTNQAFLLLKDASPTVDLGTNNFSITNTNVVVHQTSPFSGNTYSGMTIAGVDILKDTTFVTKDFLMSHYSQVYNNVRNNQMYSWGRNDQGQLGENTTNSRSLPVAVTNNGYSTDPIWKDIVMGGKDGNEFTVAIKTDGTIWSWGNNVDSQLGQGDTTPRSSPVQISTGNTWKKAYAGKDCNSVILFQDNSNYALDAFIMGSGANGVFMQGNETSYTTPTNASILNGTIDIGTSHVISVASSSPQSPGTLWTWGKNTYGQLGVGSTTDSFTAVQVGATAGWRSASVGRNHSAAVTEMGYLFTWGRNDYGQLGDNTTVDKSSPVQTVAGGVDWKYVSCGANMTAGIKKNGSLWVWGENTLGFLGTNNTTHYSSPVQTVAGGTDWKIVMINEGGVGAIKTDGSLWGWGTNTYGRLGNNTTTPKSSPIQISRGSEFWITVGMSRNSFIGAQELTENF